MDFGLLNSNEIFITFARFIKYTAASQGNHSKATTADFSDDAEAALDYLKTRKEVIPAMTYWIKATVK